MLRLEHRVGELSNIGPVVGVDDQVLVEYGLEFVVAADFDLLCLGQLLVHQVQWFDADDMIDLFLNL